jgi:hypothetical protein
MSRPGKTPGQRLLKYLMDRGGEATLWDISRRSADGRLYAKARPELEGLIVEETGRSERTKHPVRRVVLTLKGWATAAALCPGWQPQRVATAVLKAWLADLQKEQDPWACQFLKDAHDAKELARLKANGWIRRPTKGWVEKQAARTRAAGKFGEYRGYEPPSEYVQECDRLSNLNLEPKRKMRPRGRPFPKRDEGQIPLPPTTAPQAPIAPDMEITPSQPYTQRDFLRDVAEQNRLLAEIQQPPQQRWQPAVDTADNERIKERIRKQGYGDAIEGERVWFDNRKMSLQEWEKSNP